MSWSTGYGLNFRVTSGAVVDATDEFYVSPGGALWAYPRSEDGGAFVHGRFSGSPSAADDAAGAVVDRRLAGIARASNSTGPAVWRIDLPAPGDYEIRIAVASNSANIRLRVLDNTTPRIAIATTQGTNVNDAQGTGFTYAGWVSGNQPVVATFASTVLLIEIGESGATTNSTDLMHFFVRQVGGTPIEADTLVVQGQPQNTNVGSTMDPVVVRAVDSEQANALDTSYTGDVTLTPTGGNYTGTLVKAAVGGVATFDDLVPQTIGAGFFFGFTSGVLASTSSDNFDITVPSASTTITPLENEPMSSPILRSATAGDKRRIYLLVRNEDGTAWSGSTAGVKVLLNGTPSTNDITRVSGELHYIEITTGESEAADNVITAVLPASAPRRGAYGIGLLTSADWTDAGLNDSGVRSALGLASANLDTQLAGIVDRTVRVIAAVVEAADGTQVTIPFEGGTEVWTRTPSSVTSRTRQLTPP